MGSAVAAGLNVTRLVDVAAKGSRQTGRVRGSAGDKAQVRHMRCNRQTEKSRDGNRRYKEDVHGTLYFRSQVKGSVRRRGGRVRWEQR